MGLLNRLLGGGSSDPLAALPAPLKRAHQILERCHSAKHITGAECKEVNELLQKSRGAGHPEILIKQIERDFSHTIEKYLGGTGV